MKPGCDRYTDRYIRYTHFLAMNTACQTLLSHDPTRHDSLLLLANLNSRFFKRAQSPVLLKHAARGGVSKFLAFYLKNSVNNNEQQYVPVNTKQR